MKSVYQADEEWLQRGAELLVMKETKNPKWTSKSSLSVLRSGICQGVSEVLSIVADFSEIIKAYT